MAGHRMRLPYADEMLMLNRCPGVIGLAAVFSGAQPDVAEVRARVAERWTGWERMSCVLDRPAVTDRAPLRSLSRRRRRTQWAVPGPFDPAAHVVMSHSKLPDLWAESVNRPLPDGLPPWRLFVAPTADNGGFALALVAQHMLLDGRSFVTLLHSLTDDPAPVRVPDRPSPLPRTTLQAAAREVRAQAAAGQALPLPVPRETYPSVAVSALPASTVRSARRRSGGDRAATLSELLMSAVAGALHAEYGSLEQWPRKAPVHAMVPCDLRTGENAAELGNIVTAVRVPLPVDADDPALRLRACRAAIATVPDRAALHASVLFPVIGMLRLTGTWVTRALADRGLRPSFVPIATTALRWPAPEGTFHGRRLVRTVGLPPLHRPGTASFALLQCGDAFTLSVSCHLGPHDAGRLADAVVTELETPAGWTPPHREDGAPL